MDYNYRFVVYLIWIALIILIGAVIFIVFGKETPQNGSQGLNKAFLSGIGATYYEVNKDLIDCLAFNESSNNNEAIGKSGERGILQFLPSTFQSECVEKHRYRNDIMNEEIQQECAGEIIYKGGLSHWTTRNLCEKEPRNIFARNVVEE